MRLAERRAKHRGNKTYAEQARIPRGSGFETRLQHERHQIRCSKTLQAIRYGNRLMWRAAPQTMKKHNIKPPGSYDLRNCHKGEMWGWPKECNMTDNKAKRILYACFKSGLLTYSQMRDVRRALAYSYELVTGGDVDKQANWPGVKSTWKVFNLNQLPEGKCKAPVKIPTPKHLKVAFTTPWTPQTGMPFMQWTVGQTAAWDWGVCGARPREDLGRIKFAPKHDSNLEERWQASFFRGGRAKLCGTKKGSRPWWLFRVCLCPGQEHIQPPRGFRNHIDKEGNPTIEVRWNTNCPLACIQLYTSMCKWDEQRMYPKWLPKSGRFGKTNVDNVVALAIDWFQVQGVITQEQRYDSHAGRKSLARWCRKCNVPFRESFEIHGDHYDTWAQYYENDVPGDQMERREQSRNPDDCTKALNRFANWIGRGRRVRAQLSRHERYMHHHMLAHGMPEIAKKIAYGLPSEDEDEGMTDA